MCLVRKGSSAGSVGMTLRRPTRHSGSRMPQDAVQRNNIDIDSNSAATNDAQQPVFHQDQWMEALQHQASTLSGEDRLPNSSLPRETHGTRCIATTSNWHADNPALYCFPYCVGNHSVFLLIHTDAVRDEK